MVESTTAKPSHPPVAATDPGGGEPLRGVTILVPGNGTTVPPGVLSVAIVAIPGMASDRLLVTAYPLPSPPGIPITANPITPLSAAQRYHVQVPLAPSTDYAITASLVDCSGVQRDVATVSVTTGP